MSERISGLVALALFGGCTAGEAPPPSLTSGEHEIAFQSTGIGFSLKRGAQTVLAFGDDGFEVGVVRVLDDDASYDPYWLEHEDDLFKPDPPPDLRWLHATGGRIDSSGGSARIALELEGGTAATVELRPAAPDAFVLTFLPAVSGAAVAYLRIRPTVGADEAFYGLGEWPDAIEHRGKLRPVQLEPDLFLEGTSNENHVPVPLLIGTRGFGLFVKSRRVGLFDVARKAADRVEITFGTAEESAAGLEVHLFGAEPLDVLRHYYAVTALPILPAPWALGPWIWRDEDRDQAEVEADLNEIRDLDLPTTALWIDEPYASNINSFDFNPARYPDPARMLRLAHDLGFRIALWHTPYLQAATPEQERFFPPQSSTKLNPYSLPIDFTNREAWAFWQDNLRAYAELGIEGYKLDYAEDILPSFAGGRLRWRFADGSDERTMHYGYTLLYHQAYAAMLPPGGGFLLCRAGRWGDQAFASVIWPGDMDANMVHHRERFTDRENNTASGVGGLPATVMQGIGLGASGFPLFAADTGGYRHSPPDRETYLRWFEQTALSVVMQVGDSSSEPPWVFTSTNGRDQSVLDLYRSYARLHLRLFPYLWSHVRRIAETGRPIERAIGMAYPELGRHPDDQYLLGDDLLVAPVVERGASTKRVMFPPGEWIDWWSGEQFKGPLEQEVLAPLEKLPLYLRAGGVVPLLRPTIDAIAPAADRARVDSFDDDAGILYARAVSGAPGRFVLFDGSSIAVEASAVEHQPGERFVKGLLIELLAAPEPAAIVLGSDVLARVATPLDLERGSSAGWAYDAAARALWIRIDRGRVELR